MGARILLIEDDSELRSTFSLSLTSEGYQVQTVASLAQAFALWHDASGSDGIDLVLLDLGLPDGSGADFLAAIQPLEHTPVIVISARQREQEKVRLLNMGADAYLVKPFTVPELLACVRSCLDARLLQGEAANWEFSFADIRVDLHLQSVSRGNLPLKLTLIEYRLLARLVQSAGKVVTDSQLLAEAMEPQYASRRDLLRLYMAQLRAKLETNPFEPKWLTTVPGVGYRLDVAMGRA